MCSLRGEKSQNKERKSDLEPTKQAHAGHETISSSVLDRLAILQLNIAPFFKAKTYVNFKAGNFQYKLQLQGFNMETRSQNGKTFVKHKGSQNPLMMQQNVSACSSSVFSGKGNSFCLNPFPLLGLSKNLEAITVIYNRTLRASVPLRCCKYPRVYY